MLFLLFLVSGSVHSQTPQLLTGFPKLIDSINVPLYAGASIIIADFNRDGFNDMLFSLRGGKTFLLNRDGSPFNNWPVNISDFTPITAAGDIDGDGYLDIVVKTYYNLVAYNYQGNLLPGFPVNLTGTNNLQRHLALYNLIGDSKLEIITVSLNKVYAFNSTGNLLQGWPRTLPGIPNKTYTPPISIGDLNNDNIPEIIVPSSYCEQMQPCDSNQINIFEPDGSNFPNWPVVTDSNYEYFSTPASIYKSSNPDSSYIVINSNKCINPACDAACRTSRYSTNGILLNRYNTLNSLYTGPVALGNVNNDNILEQCFGAEPQPVYLFNQNGMMFNGWPVLGYGYYYHSPNLGKLSNQMNIITLLRYVDSTGGYIFVYNPDGSQPPWSPLRPQGMPGSSPTICDLNNDGQVDMVVLIHSLPSRTLLYAWTFPGITYTRENFPWPMWGHDRYRTFQYGFIPPDEVIGIQPISNTVPEKFELYQNYPNPFNPSTTIAFDIVRSGKIKLTIYDVMGKVVTELVNENVIAGKYKLSWDGGQYSSGVYYYALETDAYRNAKKMVLIK